MAPIDATRNFFDAHAPQWDTYDEPQKLRNIISIAESAFPAMKGPILDLGSGTGIMLPVFQQFYPDSLVIEFDLAFGMLRQARQKYHSDQKYVFVQGDGHRLPFNKYTFSGIVCFSVFPHLEDRIRFLQEAERVLHSDGHLIIFHLMNHRQLNHHHREAGGTVRHDRMLPAKRLARLIEERSQLRCLKTVEQEGLYFIDAVNKAC